MKTLVNRIINDKGTKKSYIIRLVICMAIAVCASLLLELVWSRRLLFSGAISKDPIPVTVMDEGNHTYTCSFDYQYVNSFCYSYDTDGAVSTLVRINIADEGAPEQLLGLYDTNNQFVRTSAFTVASHTNKIQIWIPDDIDAEVTSAYIDNRFYLNGRRMVAVITGVFCMLFLLCFSTIVRERIEVAFVVLALGIGSTYIAIMPIQKNAWDECIHFSRSYRMTLSKEVGLTELLDVYTDDNKVWPLDPPTTRKEYDILESYLDANAHYNEPDYYIKTAPNSGLSITNVGYIAPGLGISIARLLKLPFSELFRLGKIFNLMIYIVVVYFAIKRAAIGKRMMLVISLMPTAMMTAASYSRDSTLNAFAFLGMSYLLSMFVEEDKTIAWKDYLIFAISVFVVSAIKAVYAPLLLLILLIPKKQFKDKKTRLIMKYGVFVIALLLVASFVLPVLLSTAEGASEITGDVRGGNTSATRQLQFIFANVFAYAKMLLSAIFNNAVNYTIGVGALGEIGHRGTVPYAYWIFFTMVLVAITDRVDTTKNLKWLYRLAIVALAFVITCFVWTSMYLSFTEVGNSVIMGVQGRYFIPLIYPLLMVINSGKLHADYDKRWYNTAVLANMALLEYVSLYVMFIQDYCA